MRVKEIFVSGVNKFERIEWNGGEDKEWTTNHC